MKETILETRGLTKRYGEVTVLDNLDISVSRGTITGFLGPNGAGKSTTIMLLLGLIRPDAGSIGLFDETRKRIGLLAQKPAFHSWMTARFYCRKITREVNERIGDSLEMAGLYGKAGRKVGGFSGGELQRLGLAQAWIHRPELLILDEPAASLDPAGRYDVLKMMTALNEHATIFYSTRILDDVERISDEVIILNRGKAVYQGATARLPHRRAA